MSTTRREAVETAAYTELAGSNLPIGYCDAISGAIAAAVEAAMAWAPPPVADPLTAALPPISGHWTCGCSSRECTVRWDTFRDGSPTNPGAAVRATCLPHGLVADADTADASGSLVGARALAMARLDALHTEQCR